MLIRRVTQWRLPGKRYCSTVSSWEVLDFPQRGETYSSAPYMGALLKAAVFPMRACKTRQKAVPDPT